MADEPLGDKQKAAASPLWIFGEVQRGELWGVFLLGANCFVAMVAYYVLKVVREPLILNTGGATAKSYASAVQALVLIALVPLYGRFLQRADRQRLVQGMVLLFIACVELFYIGDALKVPYIGFVFFVWVGIFSLAIVAQFWSLANDLHEIHAGERLFPVIALGAPLGSVAGSLLAHELIGIGLSPGGLLQAAAGLLVVHLMLYQAILRQRAHRGSVPVATRDQRSLVTEQANGILMVVRNPYLLRIAGLLIALNLVNTTGEFILGAGVTAEAERAFEAAKQAGSAFARDQFLDTFVGNFYAEIFTLINVVTIALQAFLASRVVQRFGISGVLFALPLVAFGSYGVVAAGAGLVAIRVAKVAENSTDYSLMNTARAMLWLPTNRIEKYAGKQATDTFFVRVGDLLSAFVVFTAALAFGGTEVVSESALASRLLAGLNLCVIAAWLILAADLVRRYRKLALVSAQGGAASSGRSNPTNR